MSAKIKTDADKATRNEPTPSEKNKLDLSSIKSPVAELNESESRERRKLDLATEANRAARNEPTPSERGKVEIANIKTPSAPPVATNEIESREKKKPDLSTIKSSIPTRLGDGSLSFSFTRQEIRTTDIAEAEERLIQAASLAPVPEEEGKIAINTSPAVEIRLKVDDDDDDADARKSRFLTKVTVAAVQFLKDTQLTSTTVASGLPFVVALKFLGAGPRAAALSAMLMLIGTLAGMVDSGLLKIGRDEDEEM